MRRHRPERLTAERSRSGMWRWPLVSALVAAPSAWALRSVTVDTDGFVGLLAIGDPGLRPGAVPARLRCSDACGNVDVQRDAAHVADGISTVLAAAAPRVRPRRRDQRGVVRLAASFTFSSGALLLRDSDDPAPMTMMLAFAAGDASLAAILAFITHTLRAVRVDTMMLRFTTTPSPPSKSSSAGPRSRLPSRFDPTKRAT